MIILIKKIVKKIYSYDIEIILGVEISAGNESETHILGYFIDIDSPKLNNVLNDIKRIRFAESIKLIRKLKENKINIDAKELNQKGYSIDGFGITKCMIEKSFRSGALIQRILDFMELINYSFEDVTVSDQFLARQLQPYLPGKSFTTSVISALSDVDTCLKMLNQFPDFETICVGRNDMITMCKMMC